MSGKKSKSHKKGRCWNLQVHHLLTKLTNIMQLKPRISARALYDVWMKFARVLAFINAQVFLTVAYILIIGPISLVLRVLGKDSLDRRMGNAISYWKKREPSKVTLEALKQQF
jgi:hypothetical protein